jgi:glyoxylase-like metal-dependent hydrolase (beta-lactamase superfamily II)
MKTVICLSLLASALTCRMSAQSAHDDMRAENLKKYVAVLPSVKANFWTIDPKLGVGMKKYNGGIYVLSDNAWQSAFLVTDDGVIVFDAPSSYAKSIPKAIASVTDKPVKTLIYSHCHKDHIGGSAVFKDVPGLQIVALDTVAAFLIDRHDPDRLIPNVTFANEKWITLGGKHVQLTRHNYHSNEGDLFIYVPEAKFMMAIDCVTPGYAPFSGFDITQNFSEYMKVFDQLMPYDFDTFIGGHLTGGAGNKQDVEITKEFTMDVYETVKRIHNGMDQTAVATEAANAVGWDNKFLLFRVVLDKVMRDSLKELQPRWINRLAGVDVWLDDHVRTALIYVRWDD